MTQRPGEPPAAIEIGSAITLGGGERDGFRVPGLAEGVLRILPSAEGLILEARATGILVAGSPLPPERRRLLRLGERAEAAGVALWLPQPLPFDGTRALAGAILAGAGAAEISGPRLLVLEGPCAGRRLAVRDGAVVGRGRAAEIHLDDPLASRRHVVFTVRRGQPCLRDLSSKNGLAVNGRRAGRSRIALRPGDALALGGSVLVYEEDPPPPSIGSDRARSLLPRAAAGAATLALLAIAALLALAAG